jgi:hypothetical protein
MSGIAGQRFVRASQPCGLAGLWAHMSCGSANVSYGSANASYGSAVRKGMEPWGNLPRGNVGVERPVRHIPVLMIMPMCLGSMCPSPTCTMCYTDELDECEPSEDSLLIVSIEMVMGR